MSPPGKGHFRHPSPANVFRNPARKNRKILQILEGVRRVSAFVFGSLSDCATLSKALSNPQGSCGRCRVGTVNNAQGDLADLRAPWERLHGRKEVTRFPTSLDPRKRVRQEWGSHHLFCPWPGTRVWGWPARACPRRPSRRGRP